MPQTVDRWHAMPVLQPSVPRLDQGQQNLDYVLGLREVVTHGVRTGTQQQGRRGHERGLSRPQEQSREQ